MSSYAKLPETIAAEDELHVYADMLGYMRPAGCKAERRFIARFIKPLGAVPDNHGNYWVVIPCANDVPSRVMWSSHTDTVHRHGGQQVLDAKDGFVTSNADCLGADCTTGVWLMRQMILARVPGVYIFHRQEEVGGCGSQDIADDGDDRLDGIQFAIAFDRKGVDSVITHQMTRRCCSEAFVASIAPMLPGQYKSDKTGSFTDTVNYTHMISECTNISVGYYGQHTPKESQDLAHMIALAKAMCVFDETQLVAERDPAVAEFDLPPLPAKYVGMTGWQDTLDAWGSDPLPAQVLKAQTGAWTKNTTTRHVRVFDEEFDRRMSLTDVVKNYPHEVADLMEQYGYDADTLMHELGRGR